MNPNPIAAWKAPGPTRLEVSHGGHVFAFERPRLAGDAAMEVLYPDPIVARQVCAHAAGVQGRPAPYPIDNFGYARAIELTLAPTEGCEKADIVDVLALFDNDPGLWQTLASTALRVLGLMDDAQPDWEEALRQVHAILIQGDADCRNRALAVAATALLQGRRGPETVGEALDPVMEAQLGNSLEADRSTGRVSAWSTGR